MWHSSTHAAMRTVHEFEAPWKMGRAKYRHSAVPFPIMSQATYGCHLGGPIFFAIFAFLHMSILIISMITFLLYKSSLRVVIMHLLF